MTIRFIIQRRVDRLFTDRRREAILLRPRLRFTKIVCACSLQAICQVIRKVMHSTSHYYLLHTRYISTFLNFEHKSSYYNVGDINLFGSICSKFCGRVKNTAPSRRHLQAQGQNRLESHVGQQCMCVRLKKVLFAFVP